MFARVHYYNVFIIPLSFYRPRKGLLKNGKKWKVTSDEWLFHFSDFQGAFLLSAYLPQTAWRRTTFCVPTQLAIRRDVAPTASPRSFCPLATYLFHRGKRSNAHDPPQGRCTTFGTTIAFWRFFLYLCTVLEKRLHCHSLRTANGKLTTKKRRGKTTGVHTCPISF